MKIILVNYRYFMSSGAEAFMFKFQELLEQHGHEVIPFSTINSKNRPTPYEKYFAKGRSKGDGVQYDFISKTPANIYRMLRGAFYNREAEKKLRILLKKEKPDLIFVLQEMNALSPSIFKAAKKECVPAIYRQSDFHLFCPRYDCLCHGKICTECIHGNYLPALKNRCVTGGLIPTVVRCASMVFHRTFRLFDSISAFVVPAKFTCKLLVESGIPKEKIHWMPTFIDAGKFTPSYEKGKYFLFLGRLSYEKGVEDILHAIPLMEHKDVQVKFLGSCDETFKKKLLDIVRELHIENNVCFEGFLHGEALQQTIRDASATLLPAIWFENMPNSVLESYAYGKPVIVSDIGSLSEMVEEGVTGYFCKPHEPKSLAEKMDRMLSNPEKLIQMSHNAREKCEREYDSDTYYTKMMELFQTVTANNSAGK